MASPVRRFRAFTNTLVREIRSTLVRPERVLNLFSLESLKRYVTYHLMAKKVGSDWQHKSHTGVSARQYASYKHYVEVQTSKLQYLDLEAHERRFRTVLKSRVEDLEFVSRGKSVICLGARLGAEVRAFIDLGCFAVGIDLNPGEHNRYVLCGDFHNLPMADSSVDIAYSNSIDHAFRLNGMVAEVLRVLKPEGHVIFEPDPGIADAGGVKPDLWAAQSWTTIDSLVQYLQDLDLELILRRSFDYPRHGQQLVFRFVNS